jgi:hypothetical protein
MNNTEELLKRYKKALEGLTVGGSEYYDEPERCARDIQHTLDWRADKIKELIKWKNKIYAIPVIGWVVKKLIKD